jgi:N-acetylmuramoyl-L-alanine amidase
MANEIVISSGHGKYVSGAAKYINEVEEARKVVNEVYNILQELNCAVYKFHDDESKNQRDNVNNIVKYHNSKNRDLDISIHFNAFETTHENKGVEVLYISKTGGAIAEKVSEAISKASGLKNRGAKKRTDLGFLKTEQPAILIEVCFVDSTADVAIYKDKFDEICKAIAETVSGKKLPEKPVVVEPNPKILTGGLTPEALKEVENFLQERNMYYKIVK